VPLGGDSGHSDAHIAAFTEPGPFSPSADRACRSVNLPEDPLAFFCGGPGIPVHYVGDSKPLRFKLRTLRRASE
jgi:hypothetical protein